MTYTQRIEVHQRWRSKDKRDNGRTVDVIGVGRGANDPGNNGYVTVLGVRRSLMRARTLHTRYTLVSAPAAAQDQARRTDAPSIEEEPA